MIKNICFCHESFKAETQKSKLLKCRHGSISGCGKCAFAEKESGRPTKSCVEDQVWGITSLFANLQILDIIPFLHIYNFANFRYHFSFCTLLLFDIDLAVNVQSHSETCSNTFWNFSWSVEEWFIFFFLFVFLVAISCSSWIKIF